MSNIWKGLLAELAATLLLSALMVLKAMMGVMPELDLPKMIAGMMGSPSTPVLGWAVQFMIGIVGWLLMMVVVMPLAGAGLFCMNMGLMAPVMTLALHLVFGAVLG